MGVGEQLDLHGVEPMLSLPLHERSMRLVQIGILLGAERPGEQGDADRQRYNERRRRMDGERRVPVDVVKAGDDDIKNSAARDLPLGIISGARAAQKQQMQERHHKRSPISGQVVDVGQHLFAIPGFIPDVLESVATGDGSCRRLLLASGNRRPGK